MRGAAEERRRQREADGRWTFDIEGGLTVPESGARGAEVQRGLTMSMSILRYPYDADDKMLTDQVSAALKRKAPAPPYFPRISPSYQSPGSIQYLLVRCVPGGERWVHGRLQVPRGEAGPEVPDEHGQVWVLLLGVDSVGHLG